MGHARRGRPRRPCRGGRRRRCVAGGARSVAPRREEGAIALNPERIGHTYPPFTYEVCREKLREYAEATGVTDPIYRADPREVALEEIVAPPTFAACVCLGRLETLIADPELGAHWNLVHGSQAFAFQRALRGGDVLRCTPRVADISAKGPMELLTYEVACVDATTEEPVVTARSVIVFFADGTNR